MEPVALQVPKRRVRHKLGRFKFTVEAAARDHLAVYFFRLWPLGEVVGRTRLFWPDLFAYEPGLMGPAGGSTLLLLIVDSDLRISNFQKVGACSEPLWGPASDLT